MNIKKVSDQELRAWYIETREDGREEALATLTDPGVLKLARTAVMLEVERARSSFKKSADPFVQSLAKSYEATQFLLVSKLSSPFS